jgi:hypothetical protein
VSNPADIGDRVGGGEGEADCPQERQVGEIVAHERGGAGVDAVALAQRSQQRQLVGHPLMNVGHAEIGHAPRYGRRGPPGDDGHGEACGERDDDGVAIMDVKDFPLLTTRAVDEAAVRKHPVDVQDEEPDPPGPSRQP